ncbi:arylsulfatase [Paludisphaera soli]|uniref:arylsulfatase n=1 Tax=Paludisphaera soli TaxID=2712865 RepID=UPI0013E9B7D9|nr:arylsulfatase [Paludisphaera soli]
MRHSRSLVRTAVTWLAALAAIVVGPSRGVADEPRPNVVLIMADDLGYGALGCYGQEKVKTPRLDRMAAEGLRFTQAYAGSSQCAPSRASLLLGVHTGRTPVRSNADPGLRAVDQGRTIASVLQKAGYATGGFGKWGLGDVGSPGAPWLQGFDLFFGFLDQTHAHFHYTDHLFRNDRRVELPENRDGRRVRYAPDRVVDEALGFIRANRDRPFFAYLAVTPPHAEIDAPEDSIAPYRGAFPETPFPGGHYAAQPTPRAAYAGMVGRLDGDVGRVLDLLQELGLDERTLVIFTSDNGPITAGGADPAFFRNAGPLRGLKFTFYEGGVRVPLIVRQPGRVPAGRTTDVVWSLADFYPTAVQLAGAATPEGVELQGRSALPTFRGEAQPPREEPLYWEAPVRTPRPGLTQAGRIGRYKGIIPAPGETLEIYDLEADVAESRDLAADRPDLAASFRELFASEHREP